MILQTLYKKLDSFYLNILIQLFIQQLFSLSFSISHLDYSREIFNALHLRNFVVYTKKREESETREYFSSFIEK
jgi:hypothetical protein